MGELKGRIKQIIVLVLSVWILYDGTGVYDASVMEGETVSVNSEEEVPAEDKVTEKFAENERCDVEGTEAEPVEYKRSAAGELLTGDEGRAYDALLPMIKQLEKGESGIAVL